MFIIKAGQADSHCNLLRKILEYFHKKVNAHLVMMMMMMLMMMMVMMMMMMMMMIILISLELATDPWGVHVDRVEIKDVRLPQQMQVSLVMINHGRTDNDKMMIDHITLINNFKLIFFFSVQWPLRLRQHEMQEPRFNIFICQ